MGTFFGMLNKITTRFNRVFNTDPALVVAITISMEGQQVASVIYKGAFILSVNGINYTIPTTGTVQETAEAINALGITATVTAGLNNIPAEYLYDDQSSGESALIYMPTALMTAEMSTYARELDLQNQHIAAAGLELYANTADNDWLDYWMHFFLVPRLTTETDQAYFQRAVQEIFAIKQNNIALEILVKNALGIDIQCRDAYQVGMDPSIQQQAIGRFFLDMDIPNTMSSSEVAGLMSAIEGIIKRQRAAGTDFIVGALGLSTTELDVQTISETIAVAIAAQLYESLVPGPIYFGAGWVNGCPGLLNGTNNSTQEQIVITLLDTSTGISTQTIYGDGTNDANLTNVDTWADWDSESSVDQGS